MNSKNLANALIITCLVVGAVWFWWPAPPPVIGSHRQLPQTRVPLAAIPLGQPAEPPAALPWEVPVETPAAPAPTVMAPAMVPPYDPQTELNSTIAEYIRVAMAGDLYDLVNTFARPDATARRLRAIWLQIMQSSGQDPQVVLQRELSTVQFIQNMAPSFDATGTHAVYPLPAGSPATSVNFVKINGRWYRE